MDSVDDLNSRAVKAFERAETYTTRTAIAASIIAGTASVVYSPYVQAPETMISAGEFGVAFGVGMTFAAVSGSVLIAIAGSENVKRVSERFALRAVGLRDFTTLESVRLHRRKLLDQLQSHP